MGRKIQVRALSLIAAFGYSASAFAQAPAPAAAPPADAPNTAAPAAPTVPPTVPPEPKTEPDVTGGPTAPAAPPIAHEPDPAPVAPPADAPPPTAFESLKIESKNGSASLKIGMLLQPQFETIGSPTPANEGNSNNLFVRRARLLIGGTLFKNFEYFFETDSPNLFKSDATGAKSGIGMSVTDAFMTWKAYEDMVKFDVGYLLPAGAHNALQGAGTLLGLDYFSNSFNHQFAFNTGGAAVPVAGRDAGFEVRGLVLDNHLEYRAGLFQGLRRPAAAAVPPDTTGDVQSQNMFRFAGRLQVNLLDAETGFFYAGTYLGKKKVASIGGALDIQSDYVHWAVDGFVDLPAGPGNLTAQVNFSKWNGGGFTNPALPNQWALMGEAGYIFPYPIGPIFKVEHQNFANTDAAITRIGGGVAWFPYGHNINLKAFFTTISDKPGAGEAHTYQQGQLQGQLYFY